MKYVERQGYDERSRWERERQWRE